MSEKSLKRLGQHVSKERGDGPGRERMAVQKQQFLNHIPDYGKKSKAPLIALAGAMAAAAILILTFQILTKTEIPFWIGSANTSGVEGAWVEASQGKDIPIRFSGGSLFRLKKGASVRVIEANTQKVILDLIEGQLDCKINGNGKTRWLVRAGTYQVLVTGTQFSVRWHPAAAILEVDVTKGHVLVSGAALSSHGVTLAAGNHLQVKSGIATLSKTELKSKFSKNSKYLIDGDESLLPQNNTDENRSELKEQNIHSKSGFIKRQRKTNQVTNVAKWKKLYDQKDYTGAINAAQSKGLDKLADSLKSEDLWDLGKAARYSRQGDAAHKLLLSLKNRFPESQRGKDAIFLLGRVSQELLKQPHEAGQWYEQYLKLGSKGSLSEESMGRLIELCKSSGNDSKAKRYAKSYLSKYPSGSFAELAHSVLK